MFAPLRVRAFSVGLIAASVALTSIGAADQSIHDPVPAMEPAEPWRARPQWSTSARLLRLGESIDFTFWLPVQTAPGELCVFPRYLEQAQPGEQFKVDQGLVWLDALPRESLPLTRSADKPIKISYRPSKAGNYLARWRVKGETLYRYFAVVDDSYTVVRFGGYHELPLHTSLHATGIAMDFPLPMERCKTDDELYERCCEFQRLYGDGIVPQLPDVPELSASGRLATFSALLDQARQMLPDPDAARCARVEMWHREDPGYAQTLGELGVVSHFGLQMANGGSWLGMPEFPYFSSPVDLRKVDQQPDQGPQLVAHQWDFCGGWHFLGPTSWHWSISRGDWNRVEQCVTRGVAEASLAAENSGRPAFIFPLYDGNLETSGANRAFVERLQRLIAFDLPKRFNLVFARALDVADYYRRHEPTTPRTFFISKADSEEIFYVMHWHNLWAGRHQLLAHEQLPWLTRISSIHQLRDMVYGGAKDPMAFEYLVVEDQRRSLRFERACPNPLWWFEYTRPEDGATPKGSTIRWTKTPDVDWLAISENDPNKVGNPPLLPHWERIDGGLRLRLKMVADRKWPDYAIVLWSLPKAFGERPDASRIRTTAKSFQLVKNPAGEYHLYLELDLTPDTLLDVEILD